MQPALALKSLLAGIPRVGGRLAQEVRLVLEELVLEVLGGFLVRGDAAGNDADQVRAPLSRLVHPRHVAKGEVGRHTDAAGAARDVGYPDGPQLGHVVGGQAHDHLDADAELLDGPGDIALADGEDEAVRDGADGLVGRREQLARLEVLDVDEAAGVVGVVVLLGLHEGLGFDVGGVGVLCRLGLHELGRGIAAAGDLDHHLLVPEEAPRLRHGGGAGELVAVPIVGGLEEGGFFPHFGVVCGVWGSERRVYERRRERDGVC